jgi:hypothetical protein
LFFLPALSAALSVRMGSMAHAFFVCLVIAAE